VAYATVTLTGQFLTPSGQGIGGTIRIEPSVPWVVDATGNKILVGTVSAKLGDSGAFSIVLPATDDVTLNPSGFGYTLHGPTGSISFALPAAVPSVDVADIAPVVASTFVDVATYVTRGSLVVNARDYGAVADGVTDDTAAIQAAIATVGANTATSGGVVRLTGPNSVFRVSALTIPRRVTLEIGNGAILRRLATDAETGPMVTLNRNHGKIVGGGSIECLNACSSGIVRVERTDGTCEWTRLHDIHLVGPGKTVSGSTGLVFSGTTTFQNRAAALTISDVDNGVRHEGGANMNQVTDVTLYNIGTKVHDYDGTLESALSGGSVSGSQNSTVFTLRNNAQYTRVIGFLAEPGTGSTFWSISSGCLDNHFIGVVDNTTNLGTDSGTRTTALLSSRTYMQGTRVFPPARIRKASNEIVNNSTAYQDDDHLVLAVVANAEYEFSVFLTYDAATTADAKVKLSLPAGATAHWRVDGGATGATTTGSAVFSYLTEATGQAIGAAGVGTKTVAHMYGTILVGGTAGNFGIQWAQVVGEATDLTVYGTSSRMELRRVA